MAPASEGFGSNAVPSDLCRQWRRVCGLITCGLNDEWVCIQLKNVKVLDVKLSDVTIGTSAAPTYLPAHNFTARGKEFNLIDGGVAAHNPVRHLVQ